MNVLVIGASGFVGRCLTRALLADGHAVRGLTRDPAKATLAEGCEVFRGDVSDPASLAQALTGRDAVYLALHTLSPQPAGGAGARFMAIELDGIQNCVSACHAHGVRRLIYLTALGVAPDAASEWLRERFRAEQLLLGSGLDVTVLRPGMIVGAGGQGFEMLAGQAKKTVAVFLGGSQKMRTIAVEDLIYYLAGVLEDARTYGHCYDVGSDDVLSKREMIDAAAELLGCRRPPVKLPFPPAFLGALAPVIERAGRLPKGAFRGLVDSAKDAMIGDPAPLRALLPRPLSSYRQAAEHALTGK